MLCSASVTPFDSSNGGYKKVVSVSELEDMLVHHLPDKYVNQKEQRGKFWSVARLQELYNNEK